MSAAGDPLPREDFAALLTAAAATFGLDPAALDVTRLAAFLSELDRWRRRVNLTGRLSPDELVAHALESLVGASSLSPGSKIVDIGTGGGFPGVPLALHRPDLSVTWLEPREKRAAYLRHLARAVPVENAQVAVERLEDLAPRSFDAATARGVRVAPILTDARFLRDDGLFLVWTTKPSDLARAFAPTGLRLEEVLPVPGSRERVVARFRRS